MLTDITFNDLADGTTEVVTTQRKVPPHYAHPQARAGWATRLDRYAAGGMPSFVAAGADNEVGAVAGAVGGEEILFLGHPLVPKLLGAGERAVAGEAASQA